VLRFLFLAFLVVPLVEIYVLIGVGGVVGAAPTVLLVILTALIGAVLLRRQGLQTLQNVRLRLDRRELPAQDLIEGAILLLAGALLLTPGFVTDTVGFLCLVPPLRSRLAAGLLGLLILNGMQQASADVVIDGEYWEDPPPRLDQDDHPGTR